MRWIISKNFNFSNCRGYTCADVITFCVNNQIGLKHGWSLSIGIFFWNMSPRWCYLPRLYGRLDTNWSSLVCWLETSPCSPPDHTYSMNISANATNYRHSYWTGWCILACLRVHKFWRHNPLCSCRICLKLWWSSSVRIYTFNICHQVYAIYRVAIL